MIERGGVIDGQILIPFARAQLSRMRISEVLPAGYVERAEGRKCGRDGWHAPACFPASVRACPSTLPDLFPAASLRAGGDQRGGGAGFCEQNAKLRCAFVISRGGGRDRGRASTGLACFNWMRGCPHARCTSVPDLVFIDPPYELIAEVRRWCSRTRAALGELTRSSVDCRGLERPAVGFLKRSAKARAATVAFFRRAASGTWMPGSLNSGRWTASAFEYV